MTVKMLTHGDHRCKQAATDLTEALLTSHDPMGGLITAWPIGRNTKGLKGAFACDAVLVSPQGNITVIDLTEETNPNPEDYTERQNKAYNIVMARLMSKTSLTHRRQCRVSVHTVTFAPNAARTDQNHPETPLVNKEDLLHKLLELQQTPQDPGVDTEEVHKAILEYW